MSILSSKIFILNTLTLTLCQNMDDNKVKVNMPNFYYRDQNKLDK